MGQAGLGVVGVEQIPDDNKYVPEGHGRAVVGVSILIQLPSGCLTVPYEHGGLAVVVGVEHSPEPVK